MSALGGKADMPFCTAKCPLLTQSGRSTPSGFGEIELEAYIGLTRTLLNNARAK